MKVKAAAIAALILLPSGAWAVGTTYNISKVCKFDIEQYCKDIPKTRIRDLRECLAKHDKDLFPQCQDHYMQAK
jgi:Cysteine rich repeat